jgi:hypothetical protein
MTLSALGIFSAAGAGGGVSLSDYELISSTILGSSTSSVSFSSLGTYSSTYKHLQIRWTARSDRSGQDNDVLGITFNGDSGSNYAFHRLGGDGSSVFSEAGTSQTLPVFGYTVAAGTTTSNSFGAGVIDILDPYSTTKNKTVRVLSGLVGGRSWVFLASGLWMNTASATSITLDQLYGPNFIAGSRFSLYGIKG